MIEIIDDHRPRFGTVRWWFVRRLLALLNVVEGRFAALREWALQEAVECSPNFEVFEAWVVEHYAARGIKATVKVEEAIVPTLPVPNAVANSTYLQ
jgi:hypothetical protein